MGAAFAALAVAACVSVTPANLPAIALIIDDLGYRPGADAAALALPGAVTYSILPFSPQSRRIALTARASGKDVLLHLPMEAGSRNHLLGPGALTAAMPQAEFVQAVRRALADVPDVRGVNNHMGSVLTADLERMRWLMTTLHAAGHLLYLDSRTTPLTQAGRAAAEAGVPYLGRDVFLDNEHDATSINAQFDQLLTLAALHGTAIAIGHPHPTTIAVVRQRLAALHGFVLVPLGELLARRGCQPAAALALAPAARP